MNSTATHPILKEDILNIRVSSHEVLSDRDEISKRRDNLEKACALGNSEKGKVYITFMSESGPVEVHTTVWNVTAEHIGLKSGTLIPVPSILDIRF